MELKPDRRGTGPQQPDQIQGEVDDQAAEEMGEHSLKNIIGESKLKIKQDMTYNLDSDRLLKLLIMSVTLLLFLTPVLPVMSALLSTVKYVFVIFLIRSSVILF